MARTFDVLFESSRNGFGFRGAGLLRIDERGVDFVASRAWLPLPLLRRTRRVDAARLTEVVREGQALRVEFTREEQARGTVPFRVNDREIAAEIVRLLPTTRTLEMEVEADADENRRRNKSRSAPFLVGLVVLVAIAWFLVAGRESSPEAVSASNATASSDAMEMEGFVPDPITATLDSPGAATSAAPSSQAAPAEIPGTRAEIPHAEPREAEIPRDVTASRRRPPTVASDTRGIAPTTAVAAGESPAISGSSDAEVEGFVPFVPPIAMNPEDLVVPIRQGTVGYDKARSLLARFEARVTELIEGYREALELANSGRIDSRQFATRLDAYEMRWRNLGDTVLNTPEAKLPELTGFRGTLLAVVSHQWSFLAGYAAALRAGDKDAIDKALDEQTRAEEAMERARLYLR